MVLRTISVLLYLLVVRPVYGQSPAGCATGNDSLLLISVSIYEKNRHPEELWATARSFSTEGMTIDSLEAFIQSFCRRVNYCPTLPGGSRSKIMDCKVDSATAYLRKNDNIMANIFYQLRKSKARHTYKLKDKITVMIGIVKIKGSVWTSDLDHEPVQKSSNDYPVKKEWFESKSVFIPFDCIGIPLKKNNTGYNLKQV
jgi:hypothetical protein